MDLLNLVGMNVVNYGKIECGLGNLNFEILVWLVGVFGVDLGSLLMGMKFVDLLLIKFMFMVVDFICECRCCSS